MGSVTFTLNRVGLATAAWCGSAQFSVTSRAQPHALGRQWITAVAALVLHCHAPTHDHEADEDERSDDDAKERNQKECEGTEDDAHELH